MSTDLEQVRALVAAGRFAEAENGFAHLLTAHPDDIEALYGLGFCRLAVGRHGSALSPLIRAVEADPSHAKAANALGSTYLALGRPGDAVTAFEKAVVASGERIPDFLVNLALAARAAGDPDRAVAVLDTILDRAPDAAPAYLLKAEALIDKGDLDPAAEAADRARGLMPNDATAHATAGRIAMVARRPGLAVERLTTARALAPSDADILVSLGHAHALAEDAPAAGEAYRAAEAIQSPTGERLAELALGWERLNEVHELTRLAQAAHDLDPTSYKARLAVATADRRAGRLEAAAEALSHLAGDAREKRDTGPLFALGQILDRLGHAEQAWTAFQSANAIAAARPKSAELAERERATLARLRRSVSEMGRFEPVSDPGSGPPPIFVVGFPRSGTTLVDRILGAHPSIGVAEEKPLMERVESRFEALVGPYPEALPLADRDARNRLRRAYRDDVADLGIGEPTILDKHPLNMKRVGLMRLLFADAPIVVVDRHPLDAVLSCLMQDFRLNQAMARFTDVAETARAYLENRRLFDALVDVVGARPIRVRYEELVDNPRAGLEPALNAVGLEWRAEMDDHRAASVRGKVVRSASYAQVTEAVSDRSVGRWRGYRGALSEAETLLRPICEELGYST